MRLHFRRHLYRAIAAGLVLAAVAGVAAPSRAPAQSAAVQRVTITMTEYRFRLSVNHVRKGTVVFTIVNKGQIPHDFKIERLQDVSPVIQAGKRATMRVTFRKAGKYYYLCTIGAHVQYGMYGNLRVTS
jgi:plastocyanin